MPLIDWWDRARQDQRIVGGSPVEGEMEVEGILVAEDRKEVVE